VAGHVEAPGVRSSWFSRSLYRLGFLADRRKYLATFNIDAAQALSRRLADGFRLGAVRYDGFVWTGDLATVGTEEDLLVARSYFEGKLLHSKYGRGGTRHFLDVFQFPLDKLAVLPGNHDRYFGPLCRPGSPHFEGPNAFQETWRLLQPANQRGVFEKVQPFIFEKGNDRLTVLGADFSLDPNTCDSRPCKYLGRGKVTEQVLQMLVDKTRASHDSGSAVIWAVHFPPNFPRLQASLSLEGENALVRAAIQSDVRYILAGHTHESKSYPIKSKLPRGEVRVICAGSPVCSKTKAPAFNEISFCVSGKDVFGYELTVNSLKRATDKITSKSVLLFSP
jgi:hypothetical protein